MNRIFTLSISILLVLVFSNQAISQRSRDPSSSVEKRAIERLFITWNSRDAEKVVAAFSDDVVYEDVATGQVNRGHDAVRKWAVGAFTDIENFKIDVIHSSGEGRLLEGVSLQEILQLKLVDTKIFESGCVALRYLKQ